MGKMGRPKKSAAVVELEGNPGRRKPGGIEVEFDALDSLGYPPELQSPNSRKLWDMLAADLSAKGLLTKGDLPAFIAMCEAWGEMRQAMHHLEKDGSVMTSEKGWQQVSPWVAILRGARADFAKMGAQFGFTPSARAGLEIKASGEDNFKKDFE